MLNSVQVMDREKLKNKMINLLLTYGALATFKCKLELSCLSLKAMEIGTSQIRISNWN